MVGILSASISRAGSLALAISIATRPRTSSCALSWRITVDECRVDRWRASPPIADLVTLLAVGHDREGQDRCERCTLVDHLQVWIKLKLCEKSWLHPERFFLSNDFFLAGQRLSPTVDQRRSEGAHGVVAISWFVGEVRSLAETPGEVLLESRASWIRSRQSRLSLRSFDIVTVQSSVLVDCKIA